MAHDTPSQLVLGPLVASLVSLAAGATLATDACAGFAYDPARSTTTITYTAAGAPASATFAAAAGLAWHAPNFAFLDAVWEPTLGTHPKPALTPNWSAYGTAVTHRFLAHLAPNGVVNAIPVVNIPQTSHNLSLDPGDQIGPGTLRIDFGFEAAATPGGFNVGQLPGSYVLTYNVPAGAFGDFHAEINYDVITLAGAVVPLGSQVFDATPGAAMLAGAGAVQMVAPGAGLNYGTVAFNPNALLNGRLRVSGYVEWVGDTGAQELQLEIDGGGIDPGAMINDDLEDAILLPFDEELGFDTSHATTDGPDSDMPECAPGKDLWYLVHAPARGRIDVDMCADESFDGLMSFYHLGNGENPPELDAAMVEWIEPFHCSSDCSNAIYGVSEDDWLLVRVGGVTDGAGNAESGSGAIVATFRNEAFSTGLHSPVYWESVASGPCDTLIHLGWSSGALSFSQPQRWTAQAFSIPEGPLSGGYAIEEIEVAGFTPANVLNETLNYVLWHRTGLDAPTEADELASGAVPFPMPSGNQHLIDLSRDPLELAPGDYWLAVYADNSTDLAIQSSFAWLTNAPNGINVLDGGGNPFMWRSTAYPAPGMQPYVVSTSACFEQDAGLDPLDLYNAEFHLWGTPIEGAPSCPADLNGDGSVNGGDLASVLGSWGSAGASDLNGDGTTNGADLAVILAAWGGCG